MYCYDIVLTCINDCRSIVVIIYCLLFIVVILINMILVMCDIDYCRFYSIYVATLYVECGPVYCMRLRTCLACACKAVINRTTAKVSASARGLNSTDRRGNFGAYDLKSTCRCESSARVRFWKLLRTLSELVLSSVSYLCFDTLWNLFRKSTAKRERCCSTSYIFPERVVST